MAIIYKYYPPSAFTVDALSNNYFFFNKSKNQNDPYEASIKLLGNTEIKNYLVSHNLIVPNASEVMGNYGICCFSKDKYSKHLWAFYAQNYEGLVVGFEETEFNNINLDLGVNMPYVETIYLEKSPTFQDEYECFSPKYVDSERDGQQVYLSDVRTDPKGRESFFVYLCSLKEKATWGEEQERRLLACREFSECEDGRKQGLIEKGVEFAPNGYKIPFPTSCVREIIIGHNYKLGDSFLKGIMKRYPKIQQIEQTSCEKPFEVTSIKYLPK